MNVLFLFTILCIVYSSAIHIYKCKRKCVETDGHPQYYVVEPKLIQLNSTFFKDGYDIVGVIGRGGKLSNIEPETFTELRRLKRLYLDGNDMPYINYGSFNNLWNLEVLDLALNRIVDVETDALSRLDKLHSLYLYGNMLTTFEFSWFTTSNIRSPLKRLYLNNNNIKTLQRNTFSIFPNITHIYLQFNQIGYIGNNTFNNNRQLNTIDLSFNHLSNISPNIFKDVPIVHKFLISFNNISYINEQLFRRTYIKSVSLHPNIWLCSCYLEFIGYKINTSYYHHFSYPYIKPNYHLGKDLTICYRDLKCKDFRGNEADFQSELYFAKFVERVRSIYASVVQESTTECDAGTCPVNHVCRTGICWNLYQNFYIKDTGDVYWKK